MGRREQVLDRLVAEHGGWVNGTELANEVCGGSEGLKRLREARADFDADPQAEWRIEERRHPDPGRSIWQYRMVRVEPSQVRMMPGQTPYTPEEAAEAQEAIAAAAQDDPGEAGEQYVEVWGCPNCRQPLQRTTELLGGFATGWCINHGKRQTTKKVRVAA